MECQDSRVLNVETQVITWGDPTAGGDSSQAGSRFFEPVGKRKNANFPSESNPG